MPVASFVAVGVGAALGAWLRWGLALWLNAGAGQQLPGGTLLANLGGGFMMGAALAWFATHPDVDPAWRLLVTTGFLGGLTTFSTFSAESLDLLQRGQIGWALAHGAAHLFGALACCGAGYWLAARLMQD